jgi:hypothetical protein
MKNNGVVTQVKDAEAVITGLKLLMIMSVHHDAKPIMYRIMMHICHDNVNVTIAELCYGLEKAIEFIDQANKDLKQIGCKGKIDL